MNKQFTKNDLTQLLERLADKSLTFGCRVELRCGEKAIILGERVGFVDCWQEVIDCEDSWFKYAKIEKEDVRQFIGHDILKGRIAKMIAVQYMRDEFPGRSALQAGDFEYSAASELMSLWAACEELEEEKSLQEIAKMIEWEGRTTVVHESHCEIQYGRDYECTCKSTSTSKEKPKTSSATSLIEFLISLNL